MNRIRTDHKGGIMEIFLWLFILVVVCLATAISWFVWSDFAEALAASEPYAPSAEELAVINCTAGHWVL